MKKPNMSSLISNSSTNIDADMFPQMSLTDKTNVAVTVRAVMDSCRSLLPRFVDIASTLDNMSGSEGVSVIIGTYNRYLSLDAIIKVLKKQKFVNHLEIIVSDAGSWPPAFHMVPDKSVDVVIYRRYDGKYHRVRSFNEGARAAKHDILIFLDDDVIPARSKPSSYPYTYSNPCSNPNPKPKPFPISEYWAFAALSAFRKSNATSIVRMPMYLSPDLQLKYDLSNAVAAQAHLAKQRKAAFQIHNWTTVNMAVRRQVWENIGGLNWTYDGKVGT